MRNRLAAFILSACGLVAATSAGPAQAYDWGDDGTGPTCENHMTMGALAWQRRGGDWIDARGKAWGDLSFAAVDVPERAGHQRVELDVGPLVRARAPGASASLTLMLRLEPGALRGQAEFFSREAPDPALRPQLELWGADGRRLRLSPAADTFLDCTSLSSLGAQPTLSVRADRSSLIRFVLPSGIPPPDRALLTLVSHRQYAGGARVGVFRADMPSERPLEAPRLGLASRHVLDDGIDRERSVLFATGFEDRAWLLAWRDASVRSTAEVVSSDAERGFESLNGRALRVRIGKGRQLALDLRYYFSRHGQDEPEDVYLRYYLRFGNDWNPSADGGKLPGLAGTYGRGGWGNRKADGYNGWTMRAGFAARPGNTQAAQGLTALVTVACHARIVEAGCDSWGWGLGPAAVLQNNRWYAVEQRVRMNTPGQADGVFEAWVDGRLVYRNLSVVYRHTPALRIESAWFDVYHGGLTPAPADMTLYLDAVVVAREYIGPMAGLPPPQASSR